MPFSPIVDSKTADDECQMQTTSMISASLLSLQGSERASAQRVSREKLLSTINQALAILDDFDFDDEHDEDDDEC